MRQGRKTERFMECGFEGWHRVCTTERHNLKGDRVNRSKRAAIGYKVRQVVAGTMGDPIKAIADHTEVLRRQLTMCAIYGESIGDHTLDSLALRCDDIARAAKSLQTTIEAIKAKTA